MKQFGDPSREDSRVPPSSLLEAPQQLACELGVVGVLAKGILRVGPLTGSTGAEPVVYIRLRNTGRFGLDHEA
jgi:hypothetical protein